MENQSEKLDHQVAGLPSLCLASSRIQFSVHTGSVARIAIKSGACARRALGHRQMLRGLSLTQRSCGPDRAARPCRLLGTSRRIRKKNVMECLVGAVSHSGLMLAVRITLLHFSVSLTMKVSKSAEEPANMALPRSERRACTWGSARIALISLLSLSTIAPGVLLRRPMVHHWLAS